MGEYEDQRGKGEDSGQDGTQSSDKWSRPPSQDYCNIDSNESGMILSKPAAVLYSHVHVYN